MSDQQLKSLIKWLDTFDLHSRHSTPEDISDGVALAEALTQIAPEWFNPTWRQKIKTDVGNNWRLKVSNLKKLIEAVTEYYIECLNQQLSAFVKPDAAKIGEHSDKQELTRLLQLILGCAVNCNQKQHYITQIMGMEESVQQVSFIFSLRKCKYNNFVIIFYILIITLLSYFNLGNYAKHSRIRR